MAYPPFTVEVKQPDELNVLGEFVEVLSKEMTDSEDVKTKAVEVP